MEDTERLVYVYKYFCNYSGACWGGIAKEIDQLNPDVYKNVIILNWNLLPGGLGNG